MLYQKIYFQYVIGYHNITNGCTKLFPSNISLSPGNERHAVRCCNNDQLTCISPKPCKKESTFEEAVNICAQQGLSLCSNNDILESICCSTGCMMDEETMWIADDEPCKS